ncbi:MAG: OmpH family outer membrane protein [Betaproteobacteria bacterium]
MLRLSQLFLSLILCVFVTVGHSEDLKIGFVNTERVFKESAPAVRSQKKLQQEFSVREEEIKAVDSEAKGIRQRLEKDGLILEETQRRNLEGELGRLSREMQRLQREFQEELNLAKNTEMKVILKIANEAIQKIAVSENFDLILQEAVYRSDRLDITDKVIEALKDK